MHLFIVYLFIYLPSLLNSLQKLQIAVIVAGEKLASAMAVWGAVCSLQQQLMQDKIANAACS